MDGHSKEIQRGNKYIVEKVDILLIRVWPW
jgi:hypothetical protein